jgi:glycosyltransferase involved in cell wall biosynthesis
MKSTVSAILCTLNEGDRPLSVIDEIKKSKKVDEIIVIDDSTDSYSRQLLEKIPGIKLLNTCHNKGKCQAMKVGVENVTSDIVVFVDTDLRNFKTRNFDSLVDPILKSDYDMVLGDRSKEFFIFRLIGYGTAYTGERSIKKKILDQNMNFFNAHGFLIEAAINKKLFKEYKVTKILMSNVGQTYKITKVGLKGFTHDLKIMSSILKFLGLKEQLFQLKFILNLKYYKLR